MIDHFNLTVRDLDRAGAFYRTILATLDYGVIHKEADVIGFGRQAWGFGLVQDGQAPPMHIAFAAETRAQVDAFYAAGLEAGAKCNGAPGLRADYGAGYYACYLIDPEGHNIEAVFRG